MVERIDAFNGVFVWLKLAKNEDVVDRMAYEYDRAATYFWLKTEEEWQTCKWE